MSIVHNHKLSDGEKTSDRVLADLVLMKVVNR